jgi:hypothetical protein
MKKVELWTKNRIADETGRSPRMVKRALRFIEPDGKVGRHAGFRPEKALQALRDHANASDQVGQANGADNSLGELRTAAAEVDSLVKQLRAEPNRNCKSAVALSVSLIACSYLISAVAVAMPLYLPPMLIDAWPPWWPKLQLWLGHDDE